MGTDIWMYAERRVDDHWELAGPMEDNKLFDADDPQDEPPYKPAEIYDGRGYALFAILADVRNPAYSAEKYECLSLPRGLPPDLSPELHEWAEYFKVGDPTGGHDPSWLTLREILDFDWYGKTILKKAVVDKAVRHLFRADQPFPNEGGPFEQRIEYSAGWGANEDEFVYWTETYAESAGIGFMEEVIGKLKEYGRPEDVRIVFWFDT